MSLPSFCKDLGLEVDKFSATVYRMSDECEADWQAYSAKHKTNNKARFWMAQFDESLKRRWRRAVESAKRANRKRGAK